MSDDNLAENHGVAHENGAATTLNLIRQARAGDLAAMGQLVDRYRNYLLLVANKQLGPEIQAKVGASDVVQQSMINAQQHFDQFHGNDEQELRAWLRKILQNDLLKNRRTFRTRKRDARQERNLQENSNLGRQLFDGNLTPSRRAIQQEQARLLDEAIQGLSSDHQEVIQLRNFQQLGFEEIGSRMGRSTDAARKLWARAIQLLQSQLTGKEDELLTGVFLKDEQA